MIGLEHASKARSHSRSGSRSPALAKPMIALAIASRGGSTTPRLRRAWMAVSKTMPRRHVVSGSNLSPSRYCLIGMSKTAARPRPQYGFCREHLSVGYPTKKPKKLVYFFSQGGTGLRDGEPGLIAYECPACRYGTSVILPAGKQTNDEGQGLDAADISTDQGLRQRKALMVLAAEYWEPGAVSPSALFPKKGK